MDKEVVETSYYINEKRLMIYEYRDCSWNLMRVYQFANHQQITLDMETQKLTVFSRHGVPTIYLVDHVYERVSNKVIMPSQKWSAEHHCPTT